MTERMTRPVPYGGYIGEPKPGSPASKNEELSPKKTLFVLVVVVGCFAVLWPKLFYPMLVANANNQMKPNSFDKGCCDVIHLRDVDTIRIMSELCQSITEQDRPPDQLDPKKMVEHCRKAVLETCGIDISAALQERVHLGRSVKQILDEVRSLNGSLCLKYNFGVSPSRLGVPHMRVTLNPINNIRQERPPHLRPEMMHPAFRERGKAIPHPELSVTKRPSSQPPPRIVEGRPGPIPGMRPGLGGAGHVVQKQQGNGMMGFLMPVYTIGFVIFFTYTLMKIAFKKKPELYGEDYLYPEVDSDENFRKEVFESTKYYNSQQQKMNGKNDSKIVVNAVAALLEEVDQEIHTRKTATHDVTKETLNEQDEEVQPNGSAFKEETLEQEDQPRVAVMGMETTVSSEDGKRWSRPDSPVLPHPQEKEKEVAPPPQEIYLEAALPPDSQILVADSATETEKMDEDDATVVLAGKMTLSVISLDSENDTNKTSSDEDRKSSSGNTSEDFEKIDPNQLQEQIDDVSKDDSNQVLDEIKQELQLEDDLLHALSMQEVKSDNLPVSDLIKEFLAAEEINIPTEIEPVLQKRESRVQFFAETEATEADNEIEEFNLQSIIDKEEAANLAEQLLDDIENELQNANVEDIEEAINEKIETKMLESEEETEDIIKKIETSSEEPQRKSEERFIPQNSSEGRADRKKKRQDRLKRDLEALTSSVEEAMGSKSLNDSFDVSEGSEDLNKDTELSQEELASILHRYQAEKDKQVDLGSEKSFDSTDTIKESGLVKDNEYLFGSREQKSLLDALESSKSGQESDTEAEEEEHVVVEGEDYRDFLKECILKDPIEKEIEDIEYESEEEIEEEEEHEEEELDNEDSELKENEEKLEENSDMEDEERSFGRTSPRDAERLNGDFSGNGLAFANGSETNAENEVSDEDEVENEDEDSEEIEEIIEYVDNTDEEGEEIIEIENDEFRNGHN